MSPTFDEVQKEAARIRRLYAKRHRGRPGRRPDPELFLGAAYYCLVNPEQQKGKKVFTAEALEKIDGLSEDSNFEKTDLRRWIKSQGYRETVWENTWEWFRKGQKVWRFIEKNGPTSPRDLQQRFNLTAAELESLPRPTAATFENTKRPKKLFVDRALYEVNKDKILSSK